jgi:hypothetical protein
MKQPSDIPTIEVPIKIRRHTVDKLRSEARRRRMRADELVNLGERIDGTTVYLRRIVSQHRSRLVFIWSCQGSPCGRRRKQTPRPRAPLA